jgi:hypothetical protein
MRSHFLFPLNEADPTKDFREVCLVRGKVVLWNDGCHSVHSGAATQAFLASHIAFCLTDQIPGLYFCGSSDLTNNDATQFVLLAELLCFYI